MSDNADRSASRRGVAALVVAAILAGLFGMTLWGERAELAKLTGQDDEQDAGLSESAQAVESVANSTEQSAEATAQADETDADGSPSDETADGSTEPEVLTEAPGFDVVRVESDGSAVIAGTAEPGSNVTIYSNNTELAQTQADAAGNFVAIFRATPSVEPQALTLESQAEDGGHAVSEDVVMLLPGEIADTESSESSEIASNEANEGLNDDLENTSVASRDAGTEASIDEAEESAQVAIPEMVQEEVTDQDVSQSGSEEQVAEAKDEASVEGNDPTEVAEAEEGSPETVAGPEKSSLDSTKAVESEVVASSGEDPLEVAQETGTPQDNRPAARPFVAATAILRGNDVEVISNEESETTLSQSQVTLASISYADGGEVSLSGLGSAGLALRAYVDGDIAGDGQVAENGRWLIQLGDLDEGLYRLRIDQIGTNGQVVSRVETPFKREFPIVPRPRPGIAPDRTTGPSGPNVSVTVQPGGTLWTLARVHYGRGVLYTQIFTANNDLIRDPDLIYPGQVLAIPGLDEAE